MNTQKYQKAFELLKTMQPTAKRKWTRAAGIPDDRADLAVELGIAMKTQQGLVVNKTPQNGQMEQWASGTKKEETP